MVSPASAQSSPLPSTKIPVLTIASPLKLAKTLMALTIVSVLLAILTTQTVQLSLLRPVLDARDQVLLRTMENARARAALFLMILTQAFVFVLMVMLTMEVDVQKNSQLRL